LILAKLLALILDDYLRRILAKYATSPIFLILVTDRLKVDGNQGHRGHAGRCAVAEKDMGKLAEFLGDESGATAIEYGLIAAGISIVIITAVNLLGTQLQSTFTTITSDLTTAGK
jgi:pilus assembly protein Flp/PilA